MTSRRGSERSSTARIAARPSITVFCAVAESGKASFSAIGAVRRVTLSTRRFSVFCGSEFMPKSIAGEWMSGIAERWKVGELEMVYMSYNDISVRSAVCFVDCFSLGEFA